MKAHPNAWITIVFVLCFSPILVLAEHESDHRYNVRGYVLDENQNPISNAGVSIRLGDKPVGNSKTNAQGYYSIHLHLHDSDIGRKLQLRTADSEASIRVTATRGDRSTKRVHYANLVNGELVEEKLSGRGFPLWGYAAAAAVVLFASSVLARRMKRRMKRRRATERAREPGHRKKKSRKRKRR